MRNAANKLKLHAIVRSPLFAGSRVRSILLSYCRSSGSVFILIFYGYIMNFINYTFLCYKSIETRNCERGILWWGYRIHTTLCNRWWYINNRYNNIIQASYRFLIGLINKQGSTDYILRELECQNSYLAHYFVKKISKKCTDFWFIFHLCKCDILTWSNFLNVLVTW